jgi:hypothetical protein
VISSLPALSAPRHPAESVPSATQSHPVFTSSRRPPRTAKTRLNRLTCGKTGLWHSVAADRALRHAVCHDICCPFRKRENFAPTRSNVRIEARRVGKAVRVKSARRMEKPPRQTYPQWPRSERASGTRYQLPVRLRRVLERQKPTDRPRAVRNSASQVSKKLSLGEFSPKS